MTNELTKEVLIDAIYGKGSKGSMEDFDNLTKAGLMEYTGNQHNWQWDWIRSKLEELPFDDLKNIYEGEYSKWLGGRSVIVVHPFEADRTPCPPAGTVGEFVSNEGDFIKVTFKLPFTCTQGYEWQPDNAGDTMTLKFFKDEVEDV